jgi:alkylation response protein AidB-like acyl-CoA dehydrogenase
VTAAFTFASPPYSPAAEALRVEIRAFLAETLADYPALRRAESWNGFDPIFSRKLGQRGWIGMTWPTGYGGHARSALERYVVLEEMLAAGAPVGAHWIADRQSGPALLRFGSEAQRAEILPRIARGECYFCIGMSEPDSGSDLASVRTRAVPAQGGWTVNGTKLWTTNAHHCHYMILFCRTEPPGKDGDRHAGTTQFVVDLALPGIQIRPIPALTGEHHFNEVVFDNVFLPESAVLGKVGEGWKQVTGELANERGGPERFLSSFTVLRELVRVLGPNADDRAAAALGRLAAHLVTLRRLSRSVAGMMQAGHDTALEAALVKDLGTLVEQEIPEIARQFLDDLPPGEERQRFAEVLGYTILHAPSFSLRGGTREILRGMIARGLGVR